MLDTPKSLKIQIAVTGRINAGKSSLVNLICGQNAAITSPVPGTTTDVVEKAMELRPLGPVVWLDTAGIDDNGELGRQRIAKTMLAIDRADILLIVCRSGVWGEAEQRLVKQAAERKTAVLPVITHTDLAVPDAVFIDRLTRDCGHRPLSTPKDPDDAAAREKFLDELSGRLLKLLPEDLIAPPPLLGDLLKPNATAVMLVPIDLQAPKGRLILPQVQAIRDALDAQSNIIICKESGYLGALAQLKTLPDLVVCDSQVVDFMVANTPEQVPCTTFSILMARQKSDLNVMAEGAAAIARLRPKDKVLIAEACTHHAGDEDIGRVKIPRLLEKKVGGKLNIEVMARDFPPDLSDHRLVIHCGSCMLNRRETLHRMMLAANAGVPITNYGMAISYCCGVLERVLSPFPEALESFRRAARN